MDILTWLIIGLVGAFVGAIVLLVVIRAVRPGAGRR